MATATENPNTFIDDLIDAGRIDTFSRDFAESLGEDLAAKVMNDPISSAELPDSIEARRDREVGRWVRDQFRKFVERRMEQAARSR